LTAAKPILCFLVENLQVNLARLDRTGMVRQNRFPGRTTNPSQDHVQVFALPAETVTQLPEGFNLLRAIEGFFLKEVFFLESVGDGTENFLCLEYLAGGSGAATEGEIEAVGGADPDDKVFGLFDLVNGIDCGDAATTFRLGNSKSGCDNILVK
jgi:hypothetical protein